MQQALVLGLGILLGLSSAFTREHERNEDSVQAIELHDDTVAISTLATHDDNVLGSVSNTDLLPTFDPLVPDALRQFIIDENQKYNEKRKLAERQQQVAPGGGEVPPAEAPAQMPTVVDFQLSGKVVHYTQTFKPTPVPWAGPKNGKIGLGTIKGQVGKPKTQGN